MFYHPFYLKRKNVLPNIENQYESVTYTDIRV